MSDTPLTDDLARGNHVVPTEFAQDLERQLMEQCKLLAMSADREEKLRAEIAGWENKAKDFGIKRGIGGFRPV